MRTLIAALSLSSTLLGQSDNAVQLETSPAWKNALDQYSRRVTAEVRNGVTPPIERLTPSRIVRTLESERPCAIPLIAVAPNIESRMPVIEPRIESRMLVLTPPMCQPKP